MPTIGQVKFFLALCEFTAFFVDFDCADFLWCARRAAMS